MIMNILFLIMDFDSLKMPIFWGIGFICGIAVSKYHEKRKK
jgi:hypothetical protein